MATNQPPPNYGFSNQPGGAPMGAPMGAPPQQQGGNGIAVAALVVGILSIVLFFLPFVGLILAVLGLVFGLLGQSKAGKIGGKGKGLAIAGLACGAVGLIASIWTIYVFFTAMKEVNRFNRRYGAIVQPDTRTAADHYVPAPDVG